MRSGRSRASDYHAKWEESCVRLDSSQEALDQVRGELRVVKDALDLSVTTRQMLVAEHARVVKDLEERLKYERNRASQALDVADGASQAAGAVGRLVRQLVDEDVLTSLRTAKSERLAAFRASRRP